MTDGMHECGICDKKFHEDDPFVYVGGPDCPAEPYCADCSGFQEHDAYATWEEDRFSKMQADDPVAFYIACKDDPDSLYN